MAELTPKQQLFVNEYLVDLNATQAALRSEFMPENLPKCNFYTYLLIDPSNGSVFYVGKGKGSRMKKHVRNCINGNISNVERHKRILDIHAKGLNVAEWVFSIHDSERDAFKTERYLIGTLQKNNLTNVTSGITNPNDRVYERSIWLLNRIKSFDEWLLDLTARQVQQATMLYGSPMAFYYSIKMNLLLIAKSARC